MKVRSLLWALPLAALLAGCGHEQQRAEGEAKADPVGIDINKIGKAEGKQEVKGENNSVMVITSKKPEDFGVKIFPGSKLDDDSRAIFQKTEKDFVEITIPMSVKGQVKDVAAFYEKELKGGTKTGQGDVLNVVGTTSDDRLVAVAISPLSPTETSYRIVITSKKP